MKVNRFDNSRDLENTLSSHVWFNRITDNNNNNNDNTTVIIIIYVRNSSSVSVLDVNCQTNKMGSFQNVS